MPRNEFSQGYQAALADVVNAGMAGELIQWLIDNSTNDETVKRAQYLLDV